MKTLLLIFMLALVAGCYSSKEPRKAPVERLQGHVSVVAGGADFVVTKPVYRRFQAPTLCFPRSVWDYVLSQPSHKDGSSLNDKGNAAWLDATGHMETLTSGIQVFVATEIHDIGPAHTRYLTWRESYGSGEPVPNYAD